MTKKKIFLVSSDPGAAQVVVLLYDFLKSKGIDTKVIARNSGYRFSKALKISIEKDLRAYSDSGAIKEFIRKQNPLYVITGTSLSDNLERDYIRAANELNIPTLSVIDWWTNYKRRFMHTATKELCLPRHVAVLDEFAKVKCRRELGGSVKVIVTGNPYFSRIATREKTAGSVKIKIFKGLKLEPDLLTILFLAEPETNIYDQYGIFEKIALTLVQVLDACEKKINLIIKFHPNGEKPRIYKRYSGIINKILGGKCKARLVMKKSNISELIASVDFVWGMNTTPLLEAMLKGKLVSSFLPADIFSGAPFLAGENFCPSANKYEKFPYIIKSLLTDKGFVNRSLEKQKSYRMPKETFFSQVNSLLKVARRSDR